MLKSQCQWQGHQEELSMTTSAFWKCPNRNLVRDNDVVVRGVQHISSQWHHVIDNWFFQVFGESCEKYEWLAEKAGVLSAYFFSIVNIRKSNSMWEKTHERWPRGRYQITCYWICVAMHISPWHCSLDHQSPKPTSPLSRQDVLNSGFPFQFKDLHVYMTKENKSNLGSLKRQRTHMKKKEKQLTVFLKTNQETAQCEETISSVFPDFFLME